MVYHCLLVNFTATIDVYSCSLTWPLLSNTGLKLGLGRARFGPIAKRSELGKVRPLPKPKGRETVLARFNRVRSLSRKVAKFLLVGGRIFRICGALESICTQSLLQATKCSAKCLCQDKNLMKKTNFHKKFHKNLENPYCMRKADGLT